MFPAERNAGLPGSGGQSRGRISRRGPVAAAHNNFYEFLPGRGGPVWRHAGAFQVKPWQMEVSGECGKPRTFDLDDLLGFPQEERIYHFRCVERWAMNVPWTGFPLKSLLLAVEPKASATHVRFVSALKRDEMPGVKEAHWYPWPYHEGLRIEEAMNELALVVTGVYGKPLLKQHGAPLRIAVPWKYGYKNPKSIVKIELVGKEPKTFWQMQQHEYGFFRTSIPSFPILAGARPSLSGSTKRKSFRHRSSTDTRNTWPSSIPTSRERSKRRSRKDRRPVDSRGPGSERLRCFSRSRWARSARTRSGSG